MKLFFLLQKENQSFQFLFQFSSCLELNPPIIVFSPAKKSKIGIPFHISVSNPSFESESKNSYQPIDCEEKILFSTDDQNSEQKELKFYYSPTGCSNSKTFYTETQIKSNYGLTFEYDKKNNTITPIELKC
jgi:hypothetical protein